MGNLASFEHEILENLECNGYAICPGFFDEHFIEELNANVKRYSELQHPGVIREAVGVTFRGIHGPHLYDDFFDEFASNKDIVSIAENALGESCYLHQFKINMKQKMNGQAWPWHEDFVYWSEKDGIAEPKLINIALLLDDSNMLSGPLCFIPGSHKRRNNYAKSEESVLADWENDLSADLNYQIDSQSVASMISARGLEYMIGNAGDLLVFNPLTAHCSGANLSPYDRRLLILTFNAASNVPKVYKGRPEFLCGKYDEKQPNL